MMARSSGGLNGVRRKLMLPRSRLVVINFDSEVKREWGILSALLPTKRGIADLCLPSRAGSMAISNTPARLGLEPSVRSGAVGVKHGAVWQNAGTTCDFALF